MLNARPRRGHEEFGRAKCTTMNAHAPKEVVVATHGYCFDGLCSAVMFTRLLKHLESGPQHFTYASCAYGPGQNGVDPKVLAGDVNAILDYRFSAAPRLTWYFDHHPSAFQGGDRGRRTTQRAQRRRSRDRRFFPRRRLRLVHEAHRGYRRARLRARSRADRGPRSLGGHDRLGVVPERGLRRRAAKTLQPAHDGGRARRGRRLPRAHGAAASRRVGRRRGAVALAWTAVRAALRAQHEQFIAMVRSVAVEVARGVVLVDLSDQIIDVAGKFVTYALYPASAYSIVVEPLEDQVQDLDRLQPVVEDAATLSRREDPRALGRGRARGRRCHLAAGGGRPAKTREIARGIADRTRDVSAGGGGRVMR